MRKFLRIFKTVLIFDFIIFYIIWSHKDEIQQQQRHEMQVMAERMNVYESRDNKIWFDSILLNAKHLKNKMDKETDEQYQHYSSSKWPLTFPEWQKFQEDFSFKILIIANRAK